MGLCWDVNPGEGPTQYYKFRMTDFEYLAIGKMQSKSLKRSRP
jgi:hypothetical protein